jgi:hypothetical protein
MIHQKQLQNVEFFKYLGSKLTNDGRCTCEIKSRIAMEKAAFSRKWAGCKIEDETSKMLHLEYSFIMYRAIDQKHLESFEIWWLRKMEKNSCTDRVRNEEVLLRVKEQRNILHEISKQKANWFGHILHRNCLLQQVIERKIKGGIEVKGI